MNKFVSLALAASALVSTPALAQTAAADSPFTGPKIGANIGVADDNIFGTDVFTYGVEAGYDHDLGGAVIGIAGELSDADDLDRELAVIARAGARVGSNGLIFASGGYSNLKAYGVKLDGYKLGVGGELAFGGRGYAKIEQRYGNYEFGIDLWQTSLGVGIRF